MCREIAYNGLQLGEVAEIEAQMFSFAQKFNRRTELELALNPPFCQTAVVRSLFCPPTKTNAKLTQFFVLRKRVDFLIVVHTGLCL